MTEELIDVLRRGYDRALKERDEARAALRVAIAPRKVWVLMHLDGQEPMPPWDAVIGVFETQERAKRAAQDRAIQHEAEHDREQAPLVWVPPFAGPSFQTSEWGALGHTYGLFPQETQA